MAEWTEFMVCDINQYFFCQPPSHTNVHSYVKLHWHMDEARVGAIIVVTVIKQHFQRESNQGPPAPPHQMLEPLHLTLQHNSFHVFKCRVTIVMKKLNYPNQISINSLGTNHARST